MTKPQDMQVFEILGELDACTTKQRKVDLIRTKYNNHTPLQYILRWNFDKSINSLLPEGEPPFDKEEKDGDSPQNLWSFDYFYRAAKIHHNNCDNDLRPPRSSTAPRA